LQPEQRGDIINYRLGLQALCLWRGDTPPFKAYELYEGFEDFLSIAVLDEIDEKASPRHRQRLRHGVIDHYLQRAILPHETEMRTWMKGAAAPRGILRPSWPKKALARSLTIL